MRATLDAVEDLIDADTRAWTRNISDEKAIAKGCVFKVKRGSFAVWWMERFLKLYEGEQAGEALILHGCKQCGTYSLPSAIDLDVWDDEAIKVYAERARRYSECFHAGHDCDWQYEVTMRSFGWALWGKRGAMREPRWIRRFTDLSIWVAKKNKKSPTGAAYGLYLTAGDGESGGKTFCFAKNGEHARKIMGEHAVQMYERSPELRRTCKLNKTTYRISHTPSTSYIEPVSSSNSDNQKSLEGINGNSLTDETHIIDWAVKRRISRLSISRAEPLNIEVSTAGDDPDGYGKSQFDLACQVLKGGVERQEFFAAVYAAPQNASDNDIADNLEEYAKMANPAMGHTVDYDELKRDYLASKQSAQQFADFKKYRLNIFQSVAVRWISDAHWSACRKSYVEDDMIGQTCYLGADISKTSDMTALVLCFPLNGKFRLLPYFYLPEAAVKRLSLRFPQFLDWVAKGFITQTEGNTIYYALLREKMRELATKFSIAGMVFDKSFGAEFMKQEFADPLGIQAEAFNQGTLSYTGPTHDLERYAIEGTLEHDGNPVLTWQIGHCKVKRDHYGNKRPIKPGAEDDRSIDGVAASLFALAPAVLHQGDCWIG